MKIAILGSRGQLGRDLCQRLSREALPLTRTDLDLADPAQVHALLASHKPDLFINCAAYNFVDRAEAEPELAFAVNALGPRTLARACADAGVRLVHFSTDYVFGLDRDRATPHHESDAPGPVSVYGQSKLAGEGFVLAASPANLVIRTCGLYGVWGSGGKGGNFVETMLRIAGAGKPLHVVADQHCTPSSTGDVALATKSLIENEVSGLVHVVNDGSCSWHGFAAEIFRQASVAANLTAIPSQEFPQPARRPRYSVLSTAKLASAGISMRPWQEALAAYLKERLLKA